MPMHWCNLMLLYLKTAAVTRGIATEHLSTTSNVHHVPMERFRCFVVCTVNQTLKTAQPSKTELATHKIHTPELNSLNALFATEEACTKARPFSTHQDKLNQTNGLKPFVYKWNMKHHMFMYSREVPWMYTVLKRFTYKSRLTAHVETVETHSGSKPFHCPVCN